MRGGGQSKTFMETQRAVDYFTWAFAETTYAINHTTWEIFYKLDRPALTAVENPPHKPSSLTFLEVS